SGHFVIRSLSPSSASTSRIYLVSATTMQRALSQLANGKTKKFVLTGADGNLGRVAADFMVDIAKPEEQVVITSYDLETLPAEPVKR
ncbi:hypothetical protein PF010_g30387, partial [Phytophthora fragariae]